MGTFSDVAALILKRNTDKMGRILYESDFCFLGGKANRYKVSTMPTDLF